MLTPLPRLSGTIEAVFFDAVGTLIYPEPSAGTAYHAIGQQFGSQLDLATVKHNFAVAFARQEEQDHHRHFRTDEQREEERWRTIVAEVLPDVVDLEDCFRTLHEYFARSSAWRCEPQADAVLQELARRGYIVGMASNFDHRLRIVAAGLEALAPVKHLVISSEVGWRKPARNFFNALIARVELEPEQILLVGDDLENDYNGATKAGLHALFLDPHGQWQGAPGERLTCLADLLAE